MTARIQFATPPNSLLRFLARLRDDDSGQDLIEYALIAVSLGLLTVTGVHGLANSISNDLETVLNAFNAATGVL